MKCSICNIELDDKNTKTIGVKTADNNFICISCDEINDFLNDEKKPIKEKKDNSNVKVLEEKKKLKVHLYVLIVKNLMMELNVIFVIFRIHYI